MLDPNDIVINKITQIKISIKEGALWFDTLSDFDKKSTIVLTNFYLEQSHPNDDVFEKAISELPLKLINIWIKPLATITLRSVLFVISLKRISETEYSQVFIILITLFKASDTYRRDHFCKGSCNHEWHNLE